EVLSRYRLTPAAQRDLSSIWDFTEERWDVRQAETDIAEIRAAVERVADDYRRGRTCDESRKGPRWSCIAGHPLSYGEAAAGVAVVRVLPQRMAPARPL